MNLPDTLFGEKVYYWPTHSIAECREHADNFVVIFSSTEEYLRVIGKGELSKYDIGYPVAAWYKDGDFDGWGHFTEDFEELYDYEEDVEPYTFFIYGQKAKII